MDARLDAIVKKLDDTLLTYMKRGYADIKYKNNKYMLLGKGGEANIYSIDIPNRIAIKVYRDNTVVYKNPEILYREKFVIETLREVDQLKDHIVNTMYYNTEGIKYIIMELYENDLPVWAAGTRDIPRNDKTEADWLSMIFQITYIFTDINSRGILHDDTKPKNIFFTTDIRNIENIYKNENSNVPMKKYNINGTIFEIPFKYRFVLGDFSRVRIAEYDPDIDNNLLPGHNGGPDIYENFVNKTDLYELSRFFFRIFVDFTEKFYDRTLIIELVNSNCKKDPVFKQRIENVIIGINNNVRPNVPPDVAENIREKMIFRSYIYELIEFNYLKREIIQETIKKYLPSFVIPSERVINLIKRVNDPNETMETLFDFFIVKEKN